MTGLVALSNKVSALETLPSAKKPLRIRGGLPRDTHQAFRATIRHSSGHVVFADRLPNESIPAFIARITSPGAIVTLGGLPPLPISATIGSSTDRHARTDLLVRSVDGPEKPFGVVGSLLRVSRV
jgi:hypothetical protein